MFKRIDIASLVAFRIMFGAIMCWEVWRYFEAGWIAAYYIEPAFHFKYYGFGWVVPWPNYGMYAHFALLGLVSAFITVGFLYRVSVAVLFVAFTYVFLLDQARYLNHFYFVSIMSLLMIFVPAHRALSLDAWLRPKIRSETAPAWTLWILRAQIAIVYIYAGVAKLNEDWLRGEPIRAWLVERSHYTLFGPLVPAGKLFEYHWVAYFFAYGGLALDLFVVFFLLWKRARIYAFAAIVFFHITNAWLFNIGIFPWFALSATLLFFSPDWPRRIFNWPRKDANGLATAPPAAWTPRSLQPGPGPDSPPASAADVARTDTAVRYPLRAWGVAFWSLYFTVQVLVPLRHFLYPGSVHWTEEGHRFSWHMKLRDKEAVAIFKLTDPALAHTWTVQPTDYMSRRNASKMAARPDMILQFAHFLADKWRQEGFAQVEVRAVVQASLNGRPPQLLIDPNVDLAKQPRDLRHATWIVPFENTPPGSRPIEDSADDEFEQEPM